jgi:hypothetical protein
MRTQFWLKSLKKNDPSEELGVDGTVWTGFMWNRWRALVNTLINLRVQKYRGFIDYLSDC